MVVMFGCSLTAYPPLATCVSPELEREYTILVLILVAFRKVLTMRKKIKSMGFSDWDTMFYNNSLSIPVLIIFSFITEDWGSENLTLNL